MRQIFFLLIINAFIFSTVPIGLGLGYFIDNAYAEIRIETDSSGSAVGSLNDGAGGFSASLKGMLDAFKGIDIFFGNLGCYIQGTFMGWDNVDCEIRE